MDNNNGSNGNDQTLGPIGGNTPTGTPIGNTRSNINDVEIETLADGAKNPVSRHRQISKSIVDYTRQSATTNITHVDCNFLSGRTYEYEMSDPATTTLVVDGTGASGGGVLLNKIIPHSDIIDGQELTLRFLNGGGLTYLTKSGVTSNIRFINREFGVNPVFGDNNFIAQSLNNTSGDLVDGRHIGYEKNLTVLLKWNSDLSRWIELHRSGGNIY